MEQIEHPAEIVKIEKSRIFAKVEVKSACGHCAVKGACGIGDCADKIIEIETPNAAKHRIGDRITVTLDQNYGFYALFLGYILPLFLVLAVLFAFLAFGSTEIESGIYSIIILIPYYFGLSLSRKYLRKKFLFKIGE